MQNGKYTLGSGASPMEKTHNSNSYLEDYWKSTRKHMKLASNDTETWLIS